MSMAQNKDYGRDCLFFRNQRLSHIHDITDERETLREGVLPEASSVLPSAGALSLKAWDQIKEDVSPIPGDSFLGVWREKEGDNDRIDASLVHVCDQCF